MRPFLAVLVAILIVSIGWIPPATMAVSTLDACPADWELQPTEDRTSLSDVAVVGDEVWAVGSSVFGRGSRRPYIRRGVGDAWTTVGAPAPGSNDALLGIGAAGPGDVWSAGFKTESGRQRPLMIHWNGRDWSQVAVPHSGGGGASLTDVAASSTSVAWAVGHRWTQAGLRPIAARWDGSAWQRIDPPIGPWLDASLLAVEVVGRSDVHAVGWSWDGAVRRPLALHWDGGAWTTIATPPIDSPESVFTEIDLHASGEGWATGYSSDGNRTRPLVEHWDGTAWDVVPALTPDSEVTMLRDGAAEGSGTAWVVGATYQRDVAQFAAFVARWDGADWIVDPAAGGIGRDGELLGAAGALQSNQWIVGQTGRNAVIARHCVEPVSGDPPTGGTGGTDATALPPIDRGAGPSRGDGRDGPVERLAEPRPIHPRTSAPSIEATQEATSLIIRDVAVATGLAETTHTFGAVAADFDSDGWTDLFIGRHGGPARWTRNDHGVFRDFGASISGQDRHGCTAADADGDTRLDVFCAVGAERGQGVKANELWLQETAGTLVDRVVEAGVLDPYGRGREPAFLDADRDGDPDLFIGNSPDRVDGLPSPNRFYRNEGGGAFVPDHSVGLDPDIGTYCVQAVDFDKDGWTDLAICTLPEQQPKQARMRLYRNLGGTFADVTSARGITPIGEVDLVMADLDRDGKRDLIQLSANRLRVSLQRDGRFVSTYERATSFGQALAVGDIDGDGYRDIYLQRGAGTWNPSDVMLLNSGGGRAFTSIRIPQTTEGTGQDVVAIDHDQNGLTDFLVLNGESIAGPIQLISAQRSGGGT